MRASRRDLHRVQVVSGVRVDRIRANKTIVGSVGAKPREWSLSGQNGDQRLHELWFLAAQNIRRALQQRDGNTEVPTRLSELDRNRATTDERHPLADAHPWTTMTLSPLTTLTCP